MEGGALMWLDVVIASAANEGGNKWLREKGRGGEIAGFPYTLRQSVSHSHNFPWSFPEDTDKIS